MQARAFVRDIRGSSMPLFAVALASTLGLVGAAVDYSRANAVKASFQSALDATVLALADKAATIGPAELKAMAQDIFTAQFKQYDAATPTIDAVYSNANGSKVTVSGSTTLKTQFLRMPGSASMRSPSAAAPAPPGATPACALRSRSITPGR
jgi:Flp pilus assembly protein TadG